VASVFSATREGSSSTFHSHDNTVSGVSGTPASWQMMAYWLFAVQVIESRDCE
jgi:hypothetical protein